MWVSDGVSNLQYPTYAFRFAMKFLYRLLIVLAVIAVIVIVAAQFIPKQHSFVHEAKLSISQEKAFEQLADLKQWEALMRITPAAQTAPADSANATRKSRKKNKRKQKHNDGVHIDMSDIRVSYGTQTQGKGAYADIDMGDGPDARVEIIDAKQNEYIRFKLTSEDFPAGFEGKFLLKPAADSKTQNATLVCEGNLDMSKAGSGWQLGAMMGEGAMEGVMREAVEQIAARLNASAIAQPAAPAAK